MVSSKYLRLTPPKIILIGFLLLILTGTLLLMLPFATRNGEGAPFLDALFTATSATCVTGLVCHDTALYWTFFGQVVILLLIQIGGLGVITTTIAVSVIMRKKVGLKQRWIMQESISAPQVGGIVRITGFILKTAFIIEGAGVLLLAIRFCPQFGWWKGIWYAVFHGISAFCNAGFDLMGGSGAFSSLTDYVNDPLVSCTIALLIVLGGIGFLTWYDMKEHGVHLRRYSLQSKLALITTAVLIIGGFLIFLYEFHLPQWEHLTMGEKIQAALFQSITPRTAGFNTVSLSELSRVAQLVMILLMLVGGCSGSTAGGFKTTTLAVLFLSIRAIFHRWPQPRCFGRRISSQEVLSSAALLVLYLLLFFTGGVFICCIDGVSLMEALFETASAVGTVGLTLGITPQLSELSHLILILLMFSGRVGGLTLIHALPVRQEAGGGEVPQERVTVG